MENKTQQKLLFEQGKLILITFWFINLSGFFIVAIGTMFAAALTAIAAL